MDRRDFIKTTAFLFASTSVIPFPRTFPKSQTKIIAANVATGDLWEVIVYNRALTEEEIGKVKTYLMDKFRPLGGIDLSPAMIPDCSVWMKEGIQVYWRKA